MSAGPESLKPSEEHQNDREGSEHPNHSQAKLNGAAKVECLFPGMHCPPPVFSVPPSIDPLFGTAGSANPLSTSARLDIFLKGGSVTSPTREGTKEEVAGWFADKFGITTLLEKYSVRDFIEKYSRFLHDVFLRNVLFVDVDYTLLYADKKNEHPEDLSRAVTRAYEHLAQDSTPTNMAVISVVGRTNKGQGDDLELTVDGQFFHKHDSNKLGIEISILGIPSALVKKYSEAKQSFEARLKQLSHELEDPDTREKFRARHEEIMKLLVADYKHHLSSLFETERVNEEYTQPKPPDAPKSAKATDDLSHPPQGDPAVSH